jgi:hypothetical protein
LDQKINSLKAELAAIEGQPIPVEAEPVSEQNEMQAAVARMKAHIDAIPCGYVQTAQRETASSISQSAELPSKKTETVPAIPSHGITKQMIETALRACDAQLNQLEGQSTGKSVDVSKLKVPRFRG